MRFTQKMNLTLAGLAMAAVPVACGPVDHSSESDADSIKEQHSDYIVKYNADGHMVYASLPDTTNVHAMEYDETVLGLYDFIQPGDTITGVAEYLDGPMGSQIYYKENVRDVRVLVKWKKFGDDDDHYENRRVVEREPYVSITEVNGIWIEKYKRDSIIRTMRQNQK